jgi:hypothetical protein
MPTAVDQPEGLRVVSGDAVYRTLPIWSSAVLSWVIVGFGLYTAVSTALIVFHTYSRVAASCHTLPRVVYRSNLGWSLFTFDYQFCGICSDNRCWLSLRKFGPPITWRWRQGDGDQF